MRGNKTSGFLIPLLTCFVVTLVVAQDAETPVAVVKFSWSKERIHPLPSVASLASQDELIHQSRREQQLAVARNAHDTGTKAKLETQISNHQNAKAEAQQTELPRDGYRYKVTIRNESEKTIKSVDWDYLFIEPITKQELARHQFTSDETIKSGKSKELSVLYLIPPVKTVDVRSLRKKDSTPPFIEQVIVARVQFADGSVWQHP
jgi:hypothetical protein